MRISTMQDILIHYKIDLVPNVIKSEQRNVWDNMYVVIGINTDTKITHTEYCWLFVCVSEKTAWTPVRYELTVEQEEKFGLQNNIPCGRMSWDEAGIQYAAFNPDNPNG